MHNKLQHTWRGDYNECVQHAQLPVLTWVSSSVPPGTTSMIRSQPGSRRIQQDTSVFNVVTGKQSGCLGFLKEETSLSEICYKNITSNWTDIFDSSSIPWPKFLSLPNQLIATNFKWAVGRSLQSLKRYRKWQIINECGALVKWNWRCKPKPSEKNLPQCHFVRHKSQVD